MAVKKISELTAASTAAGTEVLPIVQSSATVKATIDQIGAEVLRTTLPLIPTSGASANIKVATELLSDVSSTATTTGLLPAGCILLGLSTYVTDTITGASVTGYTVGDGTDADRWGDITGTAIGTDSTIADWTAVGIVITSATDVTITATGGTFTAGAIRIVAHYIDATAITS